MSVHTADWRLWMPSSQSVCHFISVHSSKSWNAQL